MHAATAAAATTAAAAKSRSHPARSSVFAGVREFGEADAELGADRFQRPRAVDDPETARIRVRAGEIGVSDALEERARLAFELVERAALGVRLVESLPRHPGRHVEQEREVGLAVAVDPLLELVDSLDGNAVTASLVGEGRVGEAIAKHRVAARERRADHRFEM